MIGRDSENQKKSFSLKGVIFIKKPFRNIREENRAYYSTPLRLNDFFWSSKSPPIILLRQFETRMLLSLVSKLKIARTEGLRLLRLQTASRVSLSTSRGSDTPLVYMYSLRIGLGLLWQLWAHPLRCSTQKRIQTC